MVLVAIFALAAYFNLIDITIRKTFGVARENVKRDIFEESKSYVHGKIQDLARYYEQYVNGDAETKRAVAEVIKVMFAAFDADKIKDARLRNFLINIRGY